MTQRLSNICCTADFSAVTGYLSFCLLALLLTGCASRQPFMEQEISTYWQEHRDKLSKLDSWRIQGRISVQIEKEAWSATLHWYQDKQDYILRIIAPLGQGTYEMTGDNNGVMMRTAENKLLHADKPETLMQDNFGWYVPLSGLIYWVRGLPDPTGKTDTLLLDNMGRVTDLTQSGWHVSYSRYISNGEYVLPGRIIMQNNTLKVRLIIKDWNV